MFYRLFHAITIIRYMILKSRQMDGDKIKTKDLLNLRQQEFCGLVDIYLRRSGNYAKEFGGLDYRGSGNANFCNLVQKAGFMPFMVSTSILFTRYAPKVRRQFLYPYPLSPYQTWSQLSDLYFPQLFQARLGLFRR